MQPAAEYGYQYRSTDPSKTGLLPYDPENPPTDVATTTTDTGETVPFIVRQEVGYLARDTYLILVLADPATEKWDRWAPPKTFNRKLLIPGGGGCGAGKSVSYAPLADFSGTIPPIPGRADSYIDALGMGFAVMSTAAANTGHNCNVVTNAEALMMVKERLIERYGDLQYTIGTGCSGGSIVQKTVANAYPGAVYDGLVVTCSYPDVLTAGVQFADYHLMRQYFENPGALGARRRVDADAVRRGRGPRHAHQRGGGRRGAVQGRGQPDRRLRRRGLLPAGHQPGRRPLHVLQPHDQRAGPRPQEVWSEAEKAAGRGFAGIPASNVGIQYGLKTLLDGTITAEQFVDLNEKVGGLNIDAQRVDERLVGDDAAIANTYRSGLINETDHMSNVAIVAHGGPDPTIAHDFAHAYWTRDRLDKVQGHHDNHVLWIGLTPLVGDPDLADGGAEGGGPLAGRRQGRQVQAPARREDRRRPPGGRARPLRYGVVEVDGVCLPDAAHTRFGTSREVAGGSRLNDIVKCSLRPIDRADYGTPACPTRSSSASRRSSRTASATGTSPASASSPPSPGRPTRTPAAA